MVSSYQSYVSSFSADTVKKLTSLPGNEDCGISGSKTGRIVGGEPAKLGKNECFTQAVCNFPFWGEVSPPSNNQDRGSVQVV